MTLADYLADTGTKPTDFARRIGAPATIITRFLRGERGVSLGIALRIDQHTGGKVKPADMMLAAPLDAPTPAEPERVVAS